MLFSSNETGKKLHTVDGTNSAAVRVDDIEAHYFAVPSFKDEEKIFFISSYGARSRRNYDYVIEIEIPNIDN